MSMAISLPDFFLDILQTDRSQCLYNPTTSRLRSLSSRSRPLPTLPVGRMSATLLVRCDGLCKRAVLSRDKRRHSGSAASQV